MTFLCYLETIERILVYDFADETTNTTLKLSASHMDASNIPSLSSTLSPATNVCCDTGISVCCWIAHFASKTRQFLETAASHTWPYKLLTLTCTLRIQDLVAARIASASASHFMWQVDS